MLDHLGIQCTDLQASAAFYDAVLAPLGAVRMMDFDVAMGYGIPRARLLDRPHDSGEGFRESHIAFEAPDRATVRAFFDAAVAAGPRCCTSHASGPSTTPTTTAHSSATPTATTWRRSATGPKHRDRAAVTGGRAPGRASATSGARHGVGA